MQTGHWLRCIRYAAEVGCATGAGLVLMDLFFAGSHSALDQAVLGPLLLATLAYGLWIFAVSGFRRIRVQRGVWGREMR
jgi:hypothetical protein